MMACSLTVCAGAQDKPISRVWVPSWDVELCVGLVLRTAVHVRKTNCFSPWDLVEFLISARINSSSPVACVIQEISYRFLLAV